MFVSDVLPYEEMKLRMLNGSHSFLAYNGSLAGYEFIYQCMEDDAFKNRRTSFNDGRAGKNRCARIWR